MFADNASATAVSGKLNAHAPISTLPRSASSASSRSKPCVSEISPMRLGSLGVDSAGVTPSGYYRRNAPGLQRGNFGGNRTAQRLGAGNRKGHVPKVRL